MYMLLGSISNSTQTQIPMLSTQIPLKFHSNSTVIIHVGSNNITHRNSEDFNADKLADKIIDIGKMCRQYGVKDVKSMKSQVNGAVTKKCEENGFHFVSNSNILRKHREDGVHLTDEERNIFAGNIVDYIRHFILKEF